MPETPTTANDLSACPKREYTRPELRELGPLADLTRTVGGPPGSSDASNGYATS
jgi:hypothetical protein